MPFTKEELFMYIPRNKYGERTWWIVANVFVQLSWAYSRRLMVLFMSRNGKTVRS